MYQISCTPFVRGFLSVVAGYSILLNGPVWAQPLPYTFTKITDNVATPGSAPSISAVW